MLPGHGHLEKTVSPSYAVLPNVCEFPSTTSNKHTLSSPLVPSEKALGIRKCFCQIHWGRHKFFKIVIVSQKLKCHCWQQMPSAVFLEVTALFTCEEIPTAMKTHYFDSQLGSHALCLEASIGSDTPQQCYGMLGTMHQRVSYIHPSQCPCPRKGETLSTRTGRVEPA